MKPSRPLDPPRFARYRMVRELGLGAQGIVHEAVDLERGAHVALKSLRMLGADEIVRLKTEFRAVRDLQHPNLVRLEELVEEAGRWFFTMELVTGTDFLTHVRGQAQAAESSSWSTVVEAPQTGVNVRREAGGSMELEGPPSGARSRGSFDEARLRRALGGLASGLAFLHGAGKAHRDLKPSNVLVDAAGRVVLIDFGVVAELAAHEAHDGAIVGTVPYMAPEQALGEAVTSATDWYAVGVLLFEALTGRHPFEGDARDVMERKCLLDPPRPSDLVRELPADLDQLCVRLLARDPRERPAGADVLRALHLDVEPRASEPAPVFLGRVSEQRALADAFDAAQAGGAVAVVLEGESGVGKSALAKRFVEEVRAREPRLVLLQGRCHEQERVPYNAFDAVIDALARYLRARKPASREALLPPGMDAVRRLFPALGVVDDAPASEAPRADARAAREAAFAALRELLRRIGERRPLVILLEDAQWADADSLALLDALTRAPGAPRMLVVATARANARDPGAPCAAVGALHGDVRRLSIEGLDGDDARRLVAELVAQRRMPVAIDVTAIVAGSHGHPMFIEELVRYSAERREGGGAVALNDALWARVTELDPAALRLLTVIAAAGIPTAQGAVAEAAGVPFPEYAGPVGRLRAAKLVRVRGPGQDDPVEPFHDRVREAVYARIDPAGRARLHAALGVALETRLAGPELLFHHFALAADAPRAARYAEAAAEAATRALAFDRAAALYRSALALGTTDDAHRRRLLAAIGARLTDAGRSKEAAESFLEAASTGAVDRFEHLELLRRAAEQFLMSGHLAQGLATTRVVLRAFGLSMPTSRWGALARLGWYQLRLTRPLTWTPRLATEVDPADAARMDLCWSVGAGLGLIDTIRSLVFVDLGALLTLERGDQARIARALGAASVAEAGLGRRGPATRLGDACRRAAAADGSERARFYGALTTLTHRFFLDNDWHGCLEETREARRLWRASGHVEGWEDDIVEQFACWSLDNIGRFHELRERAPAKIRAAQRAGNRFIEVNFRIQFVHLLLAEDRPEDARREVLDAIASWPRVDTEFANQDYLALRNLTYVALYEGDVEAAAAKLPEWRRYFGSLLSRVEFLRQDALWFVGAIALARAATAVTRGDAVEGRVRLREARRASAQIARIDLPMARASGLHLRAGIAACARDEDSARAMLREGLTHAEARGTELNAACLRWRLGALVGGDEGRGLRARASEWMVDQGVRAPDRIVAAALPGWPRVTPR